MKAKWGSTTILSITIAIIIVTTVSSFYVGRISTVPNTTTQTTTTTLVMVTTKTATTSLTITQQAIQIESVVLTSGNETVSDTSSTQQPLLVLRIINQGPQTYLSSIEISGTNFTTFVLNNPAFPIITYSIYSLDLFGANQKVYAGQAYEYSMTFENGESFFGVISAVQNS